MSRKYDASEISAPKLGRPAFVSLLEGGRQEFPNDPMLDAARNARLKAAGRIVIRRIPAKEVA